MKPCDLHLRETLDLANRMIELSYRGDEDREDDSCGILYGVMRDSGFRLKDLVTREIANHERKTTKADRRRR